MRGSDVRSVRIDVVPSSFSKRKVGVPSSSLTVLHLLGEPIGGIEDPSPADAEFFREYAGMSEDEKARYREAMKLMFGATKKSASEH